MYVSVFSANLDVTLNTFKYFVRCMREATKRFFFFGNKRLKTVFNFLYSVSYK